MFLHQDQRANLMPAQEPLLKCHEFSWITWWTMLSCRGRRWLLGSAYALNQKPPIMCWIKYYSKRCSLPEEFSKISVTKGKHFIPPPHLQTLKVNKDNIYMQIQVTHVFNSESDIWHCNSCVLYWWVRKTRFAVYVYMINMCKICEEERVLE